MLNSLATAAGLSKMKKKFHFDVVFSLEELLNCTYVTGVIFAKIRLKDGGTFSETSECRDVKSHCVAWNQKFEFHSKMYASPITGELEPCCCKVSVRKEMKGGRSHKKLGYIKINLAEYAGAGETSRKYLLESYNENKHKPDNSILKVSISLKQTSGDSIFKAPRAADSMWELTEAPEDEGIQPDIPLKPCHSCISTVSSLSYLNPEPVRSSGGSLQDIRLREQGEIAHYQRKTSSACNLRRPSITDLSPDSITEESSSSELIPSGSSETSERPTCNTSSSSITNKVNRSSSMKCEDEPRTSKRDLPPSGLTNHRRLASWGYAINGTSPHNSHKQQSRLSGQSSVSTSAYSTLSEKSMGSLEGGGECDSMSGSLGRRLSSLSAKVEKSRVNPQAVIDDLFSEHKLSSNSTVEAKEGGLKIYYDRKSGAVTLAGPDLDNRQVNHEVSAQLLPEYLERKNTNLRAIDVNEHKSISPSRKRKKHPNVQKDIHSPTGEIFPVSHETLTPCESTPQITSSSSSTATMIPSSDTN